MSTAPFMGRTRRPPGPRGIPFLGNGITFGSDPLRFLTECARRYGDLVAFRLGTWPALLVNNPADIEYVLVKHHRGFTKSRQFRRYTRAIFGSGLLTAEGEDWQRQRRLNAPAFSGQRLASYGDVMVRHAEAMLRGWQAGERVDVHAELKALTLEIAAETLFGTSVKRDIADMEQSSNALVSEISSRLRRPVFIPDAIPTPGNVRFRRALRRIDQLVARIIAERRQSGEDRGDLLSLLLLARHESGEPLTERQVRDEVITMLLAGHETTALALSWTCHLLSTHPAIESRLAAEVREVLGRRSPTVDDLARLSLCEHVVNEAVRLYPPAWTIGREAVDPCELGGYSVPAGVTIFIAPWVLHRDPRYFDNPNEFQPDRWASGLARQLPRFAYMPFGGGPRTCIGNRFAMMEAVLILSALVQSFALEAQDERPEPFPSITLRPKGGVWLRPQPRATLSGVTGRPAMPASPGEDVTGSLPR
jgi:cytochrome P450